MKIKKFDNSFIKDNINLIAGIDEVGRGPLAGPVVASAVIFESNIEIKGITDSKKISNKNRLVLAEKIKAKALSYSYGLIDHETIDKINILQATLKAMKMAVEQLLPQPDLILIDGNKTFPYNVETISIVKGDQKSFAIASASILAKVYRDEIMMKEAEKYPLYSWDTNKGYGTKEHIEAIIKFGPTPLHRKSFLKKILNNNIDN